ncbi:endonuclease MutS2 [Sandaracinus amylolyticus]|nr:Smr/MutS family protein [Sandaracinus amylolyticus]
METIETHSTRSSAEAGDLGLAKTLRDLQWSRVVEAVAARCAGPLGARLTSLALAPDLATARVSMEETREALALRNDGEPLPLSGIRDVRSSLDRVARAGSLEGIALRDLRVTLGAARTLRLFLARRRDRAPALVAACPIDPTLDSLEEEIGAAIEADGTVSDHASPELRRLRQEVANLRAKIIARLEQMLIEHGDVVQDRFHTIRDGRYVLPMRTDAHDKIPGIVHGTSGSGATVFIEPRSLIEQQNRLTLALGEMEAEEARILAQLSELVRERLPELRAAVDALDRADLRSASARLAEDLKARVPDLVPEARIDVKDARHPLLILEGIDVVPNDLALAAGNALVLSGPNAGGKTVALKLMGVFALMVRAGLPVPAQEGAVVGFFDPVLSDVGDEQSIEKNLSTFSAHVRRLATILDEAGPHALVLLDEVATGTDPGEGAALACAVVDSLCRRGAALAVTTHYEPLKAMALSDARLRNASVGFDVARMAPTFHVRMDVPGASSALAVAQRFGLDRVVIERAKEMLPEQARTFDALVRRLEQQHDEVSREREALALERRALESERTRVQDELRKLKEREERKLTDEGQRLLKMIRETRDEVRSARTAMRKKEGDQALVEEARKAVERAALRTREGDLAGAIAPEAAPEERGAPATAGALGPGVRVWVPRLRAELEIVEGPTRGRVRVASGAVKLWANVDEVRVLGADGGGEGAASKAAEPAKTEKRRETPTPAHAPPPAAEPIAVRTDSNTLDLRGLRVDEALGLAESFLDRLYGSGEKIGFLVHGVGTGALRDAVRDYLRGATRYVKRWRPGESDEGGDRVTVVQIA